MNITRTGLYAFIFISVLAASCSQSSSVEYAIPAVYFIEFDTSKGNSIPAELIEQTKEILVSSDYVLTEESGRQGWPFYLSLPRGAKFPKDSLAPPHTTIHILECDKEIKLQPKGQTYNVIVIFNDQMEETFEIKIEVLKMDSIGNLKKSASPPSYSFAADFSDLGSLAQKLSGTITRATFK